MTLGRFPAAAALGAAMLAAGLLLTACTAGGGQPQSAGHHQAHSSHVAQFLPSSPAASAPAPSPSASAPRPTPVPAQPVVGAPGQCTTGDLHLSVGAANGAAGSFYYPLQFTNTSAGTCTMYGYPGVALVSQPGGSVIGAAAVRNPTFPAEVVTLAPGAVAHASLQVAVAENYSASACGPTTAHWLQVYPPGEYAALSVPFTVQTCSKPVGDGSTLGIYVVRPGATGP
jgi:septal ring-binding cell division protein DamX